MAAIVCWKKDSGRSNLRHSRFSALSRLAEKHSPLSWPDGAPSLCQCSASDLLISLIPYVRAAITSNGKAAQLGGCNGCGMVNQGVAS